MTTRRILPDDPTFPPTLLEMPRRGLAACPALHARGAWPPKHGVAIVGTRRPTEEAVAFTRDLAFAVVAEGWAVWSGGALGIDAAAHEAAIERGGTTVVVCPSGLDVVYPPEHADLFARVVASGGTLVTRLADHQRPLQHSFHRRNDVLACLTFATVVVQAAYRSGARSTARAARALGRPLFVVPHAPWDPIGQGCATELARGALPIVSAPHLIERLRDPPLLDVAPSPGRAMREHARADATQARATHALSPHAARVLEAIGEIPIHADDLCERTSLPFATVTAALLTLTLQAVVVETPAGLYRRPPLDKKRVDPSPF